MITAVLSTDGRYRILITINLRLSHNGFLADHLDQRPPRWSVPDVGTGNPDGGTFGVFRFSTRIADDHFLSATVQCISANFWLLFFRP